MPITRLKKLPLRDIWEHEAHDFTAWLAENLDVLQESLGFELSLVKREAAAGPFSADILAEDGTGNLVVIENQLERTDHSHLGQLITYLSNLEAKTAVWISSDPRPEHEKAVHWLNETLPADSAIYLLKVEALQIDDSAPAPLFTVVAGPSPESKQIGVEKVELAGRHVLRLAFWEQLLARAKSKLSLHANINPSKENWVSAGSGTSGIVYSYVVRMEDARVELWIGRPETDENKHIFKSLSAKREAIEKVFGGPLDWQPLENKLGCRICYVISGLGLQDEAHWTELQDKLIDAMSRLHKAFQPEIKLLKSA